MFKNSLFITRAEHDKLLSDHPTLLQNIMRLEHKWTFAGVMIENVSKENLTEIYGVLEYQKTVLTS